MILRRGLFYTGLFYEAIYQEVTYYEASLEVILQASLPGLSTQASPTQAFRFGYDHCGQRCTLPRIAHRLRYEAILLPRSSIKS